MYFNIVSSTYLTEKEVKSHYINSGYNVITFGKLITTLTGIRRRKDIMDRYKVSRSALDAKVVFRNEEESDVRVKAADLLEWLENKDHYYCDRSLLFDYRVYPELKWGECNIVKRHLLGRYEMRWRIRDDIRNLINKSLNIDEKTKERFGYFS